MPLHSLLEGLLMGLLEVMAETVGEAVLTPVARAFTAPVEKALAPFRTHYNPWKEKYYGKSYSQDYINGFFCPVCGGKSRTKRLKMKCYFYQCPECGQEWFASRKNLAEKRLIASGKIRFAREVLIPQPSKGRPARRRR
jgi:hypothetical protein